MRDEMPRTATKLHAPVHSSGLGVLTWLCDRRRLLKRYRFLTIAARLASSSLIASLISSRLCFGAQGFCDVTLFCIRHKGPFVVTRTSDIQLLGDARQRVRH